MSQILNDLKQYINPDLISQVSASLGESDASVSKGISGILPSLLGGLASNSGNYSAMSDIFGFITKNGNPGLLENLSGLVGGSGQSDVGSSFLSMIMGNKGGEFIEGIASFAGLNGQSVTSMLGWISPLVMGYLTKLIRTRNMNIADFASLLGDEKDALMNAIPGSLSNSFGLANLEGSDGAVKEMAASAAPSRNKWIVPAILAAIAIGALIFFSGSGDKVEESVSGVTDKVAEVANDAKDATGELVSRGVDAVEGAVGELGDFFKRTLTNGVELNIPENGIENQLIDFIEDADRAIDKTTWFNFDRLTFDTGKSTLDMEHSREQLENITAILKAYPATKIKIGGYTDNTGSKEGNMNLSQARAEAVQSVLSDMGIAADRMEAEGYGDAHPVASNETEEGRAQNRRIALRFTDK